MQVYASHFIFFFDHILFTSWGVNNTQFLWGSQQDRFFETPRSLSEYIICVLKDRENAS